MCLPEVRQVTVKFGLLALLHADDDVGDHGVSVANFPPEAYVIIAGLAFMIETRRNAPSATVHDGL